MGKLEFEVRRSQRRKTLGLTVDREGELIAHAPEIATEAEIYKFIERKLLWVHQKLIQKETHNGYSHRLEPVSGENISYLGKNYRLKIVKSQSVPLEFDGHWFLLRENDRSDASKHFQSWFQDTGAEWLNDRVRFWEPKVGAVVSKIIVGDLGFKWGSCGKNAIIRFNWQLLQLPVYLVDYVIVHEIAHILERSHSSEFWRILDRVLPDWKDRKYKLDYECTKMIWRADS